MYKKEEDKKEEINKWAARAVFRFVCDEDLIITLLFDTPQPTKLYFVVVVVVVLKLNVGLYTMYIISC